MLYESVAFLFGHPVQKYRKKVLALYDPHSNSECKGGGGSLPPTALTKVGKYETGFGILQ